MKYRFIREALSLFNMTDPNTRCNIAGNMTTGCSFIKQPYLLSGHQAYETQRFLDQTKRENFITLLHAMMTIVASQWISCVQFVDGSHTIEKRHLCFVQFWLWNADRLWICCIQGCHGSHAITNLCAVWKTVDKQGVISHSAISVIDTAHTTSEVRATLQKKTYDELVTRNVTSSRLTVGYC